MKLLSLFFVAAALALIVIANALASSASAQQSVEWKMPDVPESARTAAGFVPRDWRALEVAEGDLDGDGRADAAIAVAGDKEDESPSEAWQNPRLLILALRDAGGTLRRSAVNDKAVLCRGCGGVMGDPFAGLTVERGTVVVQHYGGARDRWSYTDRFRYQDKQWMHIGATDEGFDALNVQFAEKRDANLVTGLVIESGNDGRRAYNRAFYELRAGRVERPPALDGLVSNDEWPGLSVRLDAKPNVAQGAAAWQGASDASARLGAVFRGDELFIRAEVTDDDAVTGDEVRVVSKRGQVVKPVETKTRAMERGYVTESRYSLKALGIDEIEARINELKGNGAPEETLPTDRVLHLSVEIVDADSRQKAPTVLSTSRGGRNYPAALRLTPSTFPLLSNFDREKSADLAAYFDKEMFK